MHFLKRSASFVRMRVVGKFSFSPEDFQANFDRNAFRDLSEMSLEAEDSVGWVSINNCLEPPRLEDIMSEPYFKLMMRIDRRKIPGALMTAHLAIEERATLEASNKKKLTRQEKTDIKNSVKEFLMQRAPVSSSLYRGLWNFRTETCILFSSGKNVQRLFSKLFLDTFSLELEAMTPWSIAETWAKNNNVTMSLDSILPCSFRTQTGSQEE